MNNLFDRYFESIIRPVFHPLVTSQGWVLIKSWIYVEEWVLTNFISSFLHRSLMAVICTKTWLIYVKMLWSGNDRLAIFGKYKCQLVLYHEVISFWMSLSFQRKFGLNFEFLLHDFNNILITAYCCNFTLFFFFNSNTNAIINHLRHSICFHFNKIVYQSISESWSVGKETRAYFLRAPWDCKTMRPGRFSPLFKK